MTGRADRWIRWTTIGCAGLLALIAGTVSYLHMHMLAELHGQPGWVAALTPLSVDGMLVAASTTLLADLRSGGGASSGGRADLEAPSALDRRAAPDHRHSARCKEHQRRQARVDRRPGFWGSIKQKARTIRVRVSARLWAARNWIVPRRLVIATPQAVLGDREAGDRDMLIAADALHTVALRWSLTSAIEVPSVGRIPASPSTA